MTRLLPFLQSNWLTLVIVGTLVVAYLLLRTAPTEVVSAAEFIASLQEGQATVVEFYTNT